MRWRWRTCLRPSPRPRQRPKPPVWPIPLSATARWGSQHRFPTRAAAKSVRAAALVVWGPRRAEPRRRPHPPGPFQRRRSRALYCSRKSRLFQSHIPARIVHEVLRRPSENGGRSRLPCAHMPMERLTMLRYSSCSRAFAVALIFTALSAEEAFAHCFAGARFFPATLATDDPCVADELSLPTVGWSKTGDFPSATEWDISVDLAKRITEDFGVSIGSTWSHIRAPGGPTMAGFGNLETAFQYQLLKDPSHELALLLGLVVEWGGTGAVNSGLADPWSTLTPTFYFGKGF